MKTKTTVRDFLSQYGTVGLHDASELWVDLVSFGAEGNYLRLVRHSDYRIDLVDCNCADTGCDYANEDISVLQGHVARWLEAVSDNELGCKEDIEPEIFAFDGLG